MRKDVMIGASLACADFRYLSDDVHILERAGIDFFHVDIMDGKFVPNFGLNSDLVRVVKELTTIPINTHLMVMEPERYIPMFAQAGSDAIIIHQEATIHLQRSLSLIRSTKIRVGVALNPATPLSVLDYILDDLDIILIMTVNPGFVGQSLVRSTIQKIAELRSLLETRDKKHIDIEVDGNVSFENIPDMVKAGATMLVGGTSSIFKPTIDKFEAVRKMRQLAQDNLPVF